MRKWASYLGKVLTVRAELVEECEWSEPKTGTANVQFGVALNVAPLRE